MKFLKEEQKGARHDLDVGLKLIIFFIYLLITS